MQKLVKTIVLINFGFLRFRHNLKKGRLNVDTMVMLIIALTVGGLFMSYYIGIMNKWYVYAQHMGMDMGFLIAILWLFHTFLVLIGSFFVLHLFCFSKDSVVLYALPLKPEVLLMSKLLVVILLGHLLSLFLLAPPLLLYGMDHLSVGYILAAIVIIMASPIMPLTVLGWIALLALKLSVVWKKHPGVIAAAGYLLLLLLAGFLAGRLLTPTGIADRLLSWSRLAASDYGLVLVLILYLGMSGVAVYVFRLLGRRLFPSGLTRFDVPGRQANAANMSNTTFAGRHPFLSYFQKEWRLFFREPIYVLNGVFGVFLGPLLLPLSLLFGSPGSELEPIRDFVAQERFSFMATIMALAIVVVTVGLNVVASSSVSREGSHFWLCRLIPLPYEKQILVKVAFATVTSGFGVLLYGLVFLVFFGYKFHQLLIICAIGLLFGLAWSAFGVLIDVLRPKLIWVNRSEAVKQNINVILALLLNASVVWLYYRLLTFALSNDWNGQLILLCIAVSIALLTLAALQGIVLVCRRQERNPVTKMFHIGEETK